MSILYDKKNYTSVSLLVNETRCLNKYIFNYYVLSSYRAIGVMSSMLANGRRNRSSIPGRVIPNTQKKWYLIPPCLTLSIIRHGSKVKWSNQGNGVALTPTHRCSSYRKGSRRSTSTNVTNFTLLLLSSCTRRYVLLIK